jgi:DHA3 family macrolide efflux protein-like MFS transporter
VRHGNDGMKAFTTLWAGEVVSAIGSGISLFGLGVWVYQRTQSVTLFSMILLFGVVPGVLAAPFAGALVDRWDRRLTMMGANAVSAAAALAVAALLAVDGLELWHIYLVCAVNSLAQAFQRPAYTAALTLLVPREQLARAGGMMQTGQAMAQVASPVAAGALIGLAGLPAVMLVDAASFVVSAATLAAVSIPRPPAVAGARRQSLWRESAEGWRYIADRRGLLGLLALFVVVNLNLGVVQALLTPLVLSFATPAVLGVVGTVGGAGMLLGGLAVSAWGGPARRVHGVLAFGVLMGVSLAVAGLRPSVPLVAAALFGAFFAIPVVISSSQVIWQLKTPPALQGRVFALRMMVAASSPPLAYLAAGPLADRFLGPLLMPGGALAGPLGPVVGVGPGRGVALLLVLAGLATAAASAAGYLSPRIRRVEDELPDALAAAAPPSVPAPAPARAPELAAAG